MRLFRIALDRLRGSYALRMVFGLLAVQALLLGLLVFDLVRREAAVLVENRVDRAEGVASMLAMGGAPSVVSNDAAALGDLVDASSSMRALRYAMFVDLTGRVVAHTDDRLNGTFLSDVRNLSLLTGRSKIPIVARTKDSVDITSPVNFNGETMGWVRVSIDLRDVAKAQREQIRWGATYIFVGTMLGLFALLIVGRSMTKRLKELSAVSNRFRLGEHQVRVKDSGSDEIAQTARGINRMLDVIVESERSLHEAQRIAKIGSWRYDTKTSRMTWSEATAELFGFDRNAPAPPFQDILAILPEQEKSLLLKLLDSHDPQGFTSFRFTATRADGQRQICWLEARVQGLQNNRVESIVGVVQDITERELAASQLRQAQKMEAVGQLTGGLAHDFNNLLAIVIGNLEFLEVEVIGESARECVNEALGAALRGAELTRQLLAFSRQQPLAPQSLDLSELIPGLASFWQRMIGTQIEVRMRLADAVWRTRADPAQVESAILNLAINARDAMPGGGVLTIETENFRADTPLHSEIDDDDLPPGDFVVITVSDTGCGMSSEVMARAWEPFFTTKPAGSGSGLGLSMIYGFAKQTGGHVRLFSEIDHGTSVRIYLPRDAISHAENTVEVTRAMVGSTGELVLVVDDEPSVLRIAARQLNELGYKVLTAENGGEALEIIERHPQIDLLLTDIVMPGGIDGLELSKLATDRNPRLKVLHASGFTQSATQGQTALAGVSNLLTKPYRRGDLAVKVREALDAPAMAVVEV